MMASTVFIVLLSHNLSTRIYGAGVSNLSEAAVGKSIGGCHQVIVYNVRTVGISLKRLFRTVSRGFSN